MGIGDRLRRGSVGYHHEVSLFAGIVFRVVEHERTHTRGIIQLRRPPKRWKEGDMVTGFFNDLEFLFKIETFPTRGDKLPYCPRD